MSDAVIALLSAMMTTIGLAVVNKLLSRPAEHWKQAQDVREELRKDLTRAQESLEKTEQALANVGDRLHGRDLEFFSMKEQMVSINIKMLELGASLSHCQESHRKADEELISLRAEMKTFIKSGGNV